MHLKWSAHSWGEPIRWSLASCSAVTRKGASEFTETTLVTFRDFSASDIEAYLREINPLDKAGAYAAQGEGGGIIAEIAGLRSNVIGLPIERVGEHLGRLGLRPQCRQV